MPENNDNHMQDFTVSQPRILDALLTVGQQHATLYDRAGRIAYISEHALIATDRRRDEMIGKTNLELNLPEPIAVQIEHLRCLALESGQIQQQELLTATGIVEFVLIPIKNEQGEIEFIACSEPKTAGLQEAKTLRLTQMYRTLSLSNQAIVHDGDRDTLFNDICRIAVDEGHFRAAWVGLLDEASGDIRPIAQAGDGEDFLQSVIMSTDATRPEGNTVSGIAVRESRTCVCNNFAEDPRSEPLRDLVLRKHYFSAAAFPLWQAEKITGMLTLYANEKDYFTPSLIQLLEDVADDVSYALNNLAHRVLAQQLHESEERWNFALEGSGDGVWDWNTQTSQMFYSQAYWNILGFGPGEAEASVEDFDARIHPEDKPEVQESIVQVLQGAIPHFHREYRLRCKDGSYKWILSRGKVANRNADGQPIRVIGTITDITTRKSAENDIQLAAQVFQRSSEAIAITDHENRILAANHAFTEITGYTLDEVIGQNPKIFASGRHDRAFYQNMWSSLSTTDHWHGEIWNRRKNGDIFPEWLSITAVRDDAGQVLRHIAMFSDISEIRNTEKHIHQLSNYDTLTGLPNRNLFQERIEQAIAAAQLNRSSVALLSLDFDRIKQINESLGHTAGNQLLQLVAERLRETLPMQSTATHHSGDMFHILLPGMDGGGTERMARSIVNDLSRPYSLDGNEIMATPNIGVSIFPNDGIDPGTLIQNAETAMFRAKSNDRNRYQFFTPEMNARSLQRITMENSLLHALEREEFLIHYQPQVDLKSGLVVGAEALLRWQHPEMGMVSPNAFIEMAEETGVIVPLGEWLIRNICRQIQVWQQAGVRVIPISINISLRQFRQFRKIENILRDSGVNPFFLEIELTESTIMHDVDETAQIIRRIKQQGIRIAVDDFGVGYSTLAYLKRFHIDKLKIDQSFMRELVDSADDSAIVRAIISMAHSLRLEVVAKGIETQKQLDFLKVLNCGQIQGYLFSKALPPEDFAALLREKKALHI